MGDRTANLAGTVRTQDNRPVANARIEVHNMNGMMAGSAYSNGNGMFQIGGLPAGRYEVVATVGIAEAREQMLLDRGDNNVALSVNDRDPRSSGAGDANSVSVAAMKVPDKARKALNKARELMAKNRNADALKEVQRALEIYPQYSDALRERGVLDMIAGHMPEAASDMEQAIKYDPNNGMAYIALAAIFNGQDKYTDALRELERGLALEPNAWQGYFESARANLGTGDFEAALRATDKAKQFMSEDYAPLHLVRAHALLGVKNYPEAQSELEAYISREPQGVNAANARETLTQVKAFTARASAGK
jgi:tetratricopeptide (TPR) repeat protein